MPSQAYRYDFSDARNVSIAEAAGEWILWLDADERLRRDEHDKVRNAMRAAVCAYTVLIHSPNDKGGHISRGHRLFRNGKGMRFSGTVHEQISPSFPPRCKNAPIAGFVIDHLGYALSEEEMERKQARNLALLEKAKQHDPSDAYVRFTLGQAFLLRKEWPAGEYEVKAALGEIRKDRMRKPLPHDIRAAACNNLASCALERGAWEEGLGRCRQSLQLIKNQATAHLTAYKIYKAMGATEQALQELLHAEEQYERKERNLAANAGSGIEITVDRGDLCRTIAQMCLNLGKREKARKYFRKAYEKRPDSQQILTSYARFALEENDLDRARELAEQAIELVPENGAALQLLCMTLLRQGDFSTAADRMTQLCRQRPGDLTAKRRLAGILMKAGRTDEATAIVAEINAPSAMIGSRAG